MIKKNGEKISVIVLAAGFGRRMQSTTAKQYMEVLGKPVLYYSLKAFEESAVDEVVLVVSPGETDLRKQEIVERYEFKKVTAVVEGGSERFHSVYNGLNVLQGSDYVLIHDGARPLVTVEIINHMIMAVKEKKACITGVLSKDTVKLADEKRIVKYTPDRNEVWMIQTPQAFSYSLIKDAYDFIISHNIEFVTDDAMVVETAVKHPVFLMEGSYHNIKITTPEDILIAELFLQKA